jgi:hypothetical protein
MIELQDGGGIEDEDPRAIRPESQVNTIGLFILHILFVIHPNRQGLDFGETFCETVDQFHGLSLLLTAKEHKGLFPLCAPSW